MEHRISKKENDEPLNPSDYLHSPHHYLDHLDVFFDYHCLHRCSWSPPHNPAHLDFRADHHGFCKVVHVPLRVLFVRGHSGLMVLFDWILDLAPYPARYVLVPVPVPYPALARYDDENGGDEMEVILRLIFGIVSRARLALFCALLRTHLAQASYWVGVDIVLNDDGRCDPVHDRDIDGLMVSRPP